MNKTIFDVFLVYLHSVDIEELDNNPSTHVVFVPQTQHLYLYDDGNYLYHRMNQGPDETSFSNQLYESQWYGDPTCFFATAHGTKFVIHNNRLYFFVHGVDYPLPALSNEDRVKSCDSRDGTHVVCVTEENDVVTRRVKGIFCFVLKNFIIAQGIHPLSLWRYNLVFSSV